MSSRNHSCGDSPRPPENPDEQRPPVRSATGHRFGQSGKSQQGLVVLGCKLSKLTKTSIGDSDRRRRAIPARRGQIQKGLNSSEGTDRGVPVLEGVSQASKPHGRLQLYLDHSHLPPNRAACLRNISDATSTMTVPSEEVRRFLAEVGAKGGRAKSEKKRAHLASIASKGGKTVTEKKRAHLKKAAAARWAKEKGNSPSPSQEPG